MRRPIGRQRPRPRGNDVSLLLETGGVRWHRSRGLTADVGVMSPIRHPPDQPLADMNRTQQGQVVEMGAAMERIVDRKLNPRTRIRPESLDHGRDRRRHRPEVHRDVFRLRQHLAVGDEDCC